MLNFSEQKNEKKTLSSSMDGNVGLALLNMFVEKTKLAI